MDTTLSMSEPHEQHYTLGTKPREADACHQNWSEPSKAKIDFNPYYRGCSRPRRRDAECCMNCHKRSTYPGFSNNNMRGIPWRGELPSGNDCFADQLRLDYIWSLSPLDSASKLGQSYLRVEQQLTTASARLELR